MYDEKIISTQIESYIQNFHIYQTLLLKTLGKYHIPVSSPHSGLSAVFWTWSWEATTVLSHPQPAPMCYRIPIKFPVWIKAHLGLPFPPQSIQSLPNSSHSSSVYFANSLSTRLSFSSILAHVSIWVTSPPSALRNTTQSCLCSGRSWVVLSAQHLFFLLVPLTGTLFQSIKHYWPLFVCLMHEYTYSISLIFFLITEEATPASRFSNSKRTYRKSTQLKVIAVEIFIY